ncbi:glycosyl hydrolase family 2 [Phlyctema vagabunda]|uniref:Glycosyl hydrolase family 2 n=1 Tax=Phlyctema vagabunda TaxID=108571 RepID=A0ABR4P9J3_9HELO
MDGLCFSNHTPTPGLTEFKKVIEPVRSWLTDGKLVLDNGYDFITLKHLTATFKLEEFGSSKNIVLTGSLDIPEILPGTEGTIDLPSKIFDNPTATERWLTVTYRQSCSTSWSEAGHEIAWMQAKIGSSDARLDPNSSPSDFTDLFVQSSKLQYNVLTHNSRFTFDRVHGSLTSWTSNGKSLFEADPITGSALTPSFWRAPTDNDMPGDYPLWQRYGLDTMSSQLRSFDHKLESGVLEIKIVTYLSPPILGWGFTATTKYLISPAGKLTVKVHVEPLGPAPPTLPRIGLNVRLNNALDAASWLGLGPGESYPDKRSSQKRGIYSLPLARLQTPYDVPQENGNRTETSWCKMLDDHGHGIQVRFSSKTEDRFHWVASRHSAETLTKAKHPIDLTEEKAVLWRLDAETAGVGSAACGPGVKDEFQVKCRETEFAFQFETIHG